MKKHTRVRRALYVVVAFALVGGSVLSGFIGKTSALQVQSRSITMSSSTNGTVAAGQNVSYHVLFNVASSGNVGGIVVDFCDNTPLIGDTTCSTISGFSLSGSPAVTTTGSIGSSGWTAAASGPNNSVLKLSKSSSVPNLNAGDTVDFTITTVTNPDSDNHSFYARLLTYAAAADLTNYTVSGTTRSSTPAQVDYGGVALSTGKPFTITARVMETLSFCVYKASCGDDPSITLGEGANLVLSTSIISDDVVNFSLSTNAQNGGFIRMKGDTLKSGSNDINAAGSSPTLFSGGTEMFGATLTAAGTNITASSPYNSGTADTYGFDTNTTDGTMSTYGDLLATLSAPANNSVSTVTFAATASNTTAAGIYTSTVQFLAAGTF